MVFFSYSEWADVCCVFSFAIYLRNGNSCFSLEPPEIDNMSLFNAAATNVLVIRLLN